ncbi:MAG: 4a-hydroxytetrahydrobiopterin dehydratase [Nocardioides sp.]|nr:4a-hydroxytetrahydrobiopterin dehydratase [Nocardioides sp.]
MSISEDDRRVLTAREVDAAGLDDWRPMLGPIMARFATGDFATGLRLVQAIAEAAEAADHHPDVTLTYPRVDVRLVSHDVGGPTMRDVRLATTISGLAADLGVAAETAAISVLELGLDTHDADEIRPFWGALLGHDVTDPSFDGHDVVDPDGVKPAIWFQDSAPPDSGEAPAQRWHLDLRVPPEVVQDRIAAALAAGGTLVTDEHAPAFWVLADGQGNQACLTTWEGRD